MVFRFKPSFELLEAREVPAVNWDWAPQFGSMDSGDFRNWTNDGGLGRMDTSWGSSDVGVT